MQTSKQWPISTMSRDILASSIGRFLRTHRQGIKLLGEFMASTPADRTEEQFEQERQQEAAKLEAAAERVRANPSLAARRAAGPSAVIRNPTGAQNA
jgi:hypothetical protein